MRYEAEKWRQEGRDESAYKEDEGRYKLRDSGDLNCFRGQRLVPPAHGEKASIHHSNDLSHYAHCLAWLSTVEINTTI